MSGKIYDGLRNSTEGEKVFDAWKKFIGINKGYSGKTYQEIIGCTLALDRDKWRRYWVSGNSSDIPHEIL
jgi:hypothetical protein